MRASKLAATVKRKPLAKSLPNVLGSWTASKKGEKDLSRRIDIVSEQLCDDVIGYLEPTLAQHKGCTLVDFEPGTCLFSSKLHDYLKPKKHILLEPDRRYYKPFIKPLLDLKDSKYYHGTLPSSTHASLRWDHATRTKLDPKLLPDRKPLSPDDPKRMQFDPSLLVIGNLARRGNQRRVSSNERSFELQRLVLFAMAKDLLSKAGLFEAGLVRMLWWLPDAAKPTVMSANVPNNRTAYSLGLDTTFDISEVTGVQPMHALLDTLYMKQSRRITEFDALTFGKTVTRASKLGIKTPAMKALQPLPSTKDAAKRGAKFKSPFKALAKTKAALEEKIIAVSDRLKEVSVWAGVARIAKSKHEEQIMKATRTFAYPQCEQIEPLHANQMKQTEDDRGGATRTIVLVDLGLRMLHLEASVKEVEERAALSKADLNRLQSRILNLDKQFRKLLHNGGERNVRDVGRLLEDQVAFFSPTQLLAWDRRSYEPLQAKGSDFYPSTSEAALLDFMPKPVDLAVPDLADSAESSKLFAQLLTPLLASKKLSLPAALEHIAVNAGKDLVPQVPAITDARRGGRLNPQNLKSRMLTTEMLEGLVKAWFEWPFKPQSWELILATANAEGLEEAKEGEVDDLTVGS